jgi:DNA-binding response OmpR family regulator
MKLLLIEDDEHVAEVLADAIAAEGHETPITHTGEDGLAYLARERPDAVVLDVRLPTLNGVGVLRKIRSTDPDLPVIIMTGLATQGELAEIRRLGVTEIVEKPEVLKHFGDALARIARRDRAQDAT